jgi:hypothetical protein
MEMLVVLLVLMVQVVVEQVMVENHILRIMLQEQVVLEYKHHQHSEILMQDMVQIFLEEIHLEMIGDSLVEAVVVEILVLLSLVVVHGMVVLEYQEDHFMEVELVPEMHLHQQRQIQMELPTLVEVVEEEVILHKEEQMVALVSFLSLTQPDKYLKT